MPLSQHPLIKLACPADNELLKSSSKNDDANSHRAWKGREVPNLHTSCSGSHSRCCRLLHEALLACIPG